MSNNKIKANTSAHFLVLKKKKNSLLHVTVFVAVLLM